jgi:hypothetical protein
VSDAAERLRRTFDEGPAAGLGAHVRRDAPLRADGLRDLLDPLALARADRHARAFDHELGRDRPAEALARRRDEHPFVLETQVHG